jgi:hypothetical protein
MAALVLLLAGAAIPALPYIVVTGRFTGKVNVVPSPVPTVAPQPVGAATGVPPVMVLPYIARELFETFFWPCAMVLGLAIVMKPRLWGRPRLRVPVLLWIGIWTSVMAGLLLWPGKGYLDGRHTLPLTFLLFGLLGLALAVWERPMRVWMDVVRRRPGAWERLPAWRKWRGWPRAFAGCVIGLMLLPGLIEMAAERPRSDRINLIQAAEWIRTRTAGDVVFADHERLVGFYSGHAYGQWFGTPEKPELHQLEEIRRRYASAVTSERSVRVPLVAGMMYELGSGEVPALAIGPYRAIASFRSGSKGVREWGSGDGGHDHLYVLYALPDDRILREGGTAAPLAALPQPGTP